MLKNSDGTPYEVLSKPNPLTLDQVWHEIIVYNNKNYKVITDIISPIVKETIVEPIVEPVAIVEEIEKPEPIVEEKPPEPEPIIEPELPKIEVVIEEKPPEPEPISEEKSPELEPIVEESGELLIHILPALNIKDSLYGETKVSYGKKAIFKGIITKREMLFIEIFTNIEISLNSIIYPFKYTDGSSFEDYRWWKVTEIQKKKGFLIKGILSDITPNFSD